MEMGRFDPLYICGLDGLVEWQIVNGKDVAEPAKSEKLQRLETQ
jgi:hypothetical protein